MKHVRRFARMWTIVFVAVSLFVYAAAGIVAFISVGGQVMSDVFFVLSLVGVIAIIGWGVLGIRVLISGKRIDTMVDGFGREEPIYAKGPHGVTTGAWISRPYKDGTTWRQKTIPWQEVLKTYPSHADEARAWIEQQKEQL